MNKKAKILYVYLALFAFTLGFAFTLASQAKAELGCCVVDWCDPEQTEPAIQGHQVKVMWWTECHYTGTNPCDMTFICADPPR
jgi:hypothetical protein